MIRFGSNIVSRVAFHSVVVHVIRTGIPVILETLLCEIRRNAQAGPPFGRLKFCANFFSPFAPEFWLAVKV